MSEMEMVVVIQAISMVVFVIGVLVVLYRQGVPAADQSLSEGIQARLDDRRFMQIMEERYQKLGAQQQAVFDTMLGFMQVIAPVTGIRSDDVLVDLLEDVKHPGPETEVVG